ncbi:cysteine--tRNA ligase [Haloplasma contractile]|uniref:Cysteine--tRNA ligase n=1 Tax=Haloplasma contractile SSD-17B TaxID=1033810 RepID=U2DVK9_9MOLU|nr:cysteine--tRNA ligase [Haloplasma contractile]ERJ12407.1 Cysteine--tRNA ligase protein [Haloplasma contractile SSD-17B]
MKLYNSLTNKNEEFIPKNKDHIKMYVCGPTVYNYIHIGNARPVVFFDVVRRYLLHLGYDVSFVSNITDVDDKIINKAKELNTSEKDIATKYTEAFLEDVQTLRCLPFDHNPKVTEYMPKIIEFIETLVEREFAYVVDGDVYFRVGKLDDYGELSNQETKNLEVGSRITENDKKENSLDFTLWKRTSDGINWNSPWGKGRPGWHTECVAMIHDVLGDEIDIHGGGSDLKFPHHENEIAQSMAVAGTKLARYWIHNGRLTIDEEKMSKSIGNTVITKEFLKKHDYRVLRLFLLSTHYRQPVNYTDEVVTSTNKELEKIYKAKYNLQLKLDRERLLDNNDAYNVDLMAEFEEAMNDDFNTSNAMTVIFKLVKEINKSVRQKLDDELTKTLTTNLNTLNTLLDVFGINYEIPRLTDKHRELIEKREEARLNKDFETADQIRDKLKEKGIII